MTSTSTPAVTRVRWIDSLRGLAVALMVLDHVLVQVAPVHPLRYTLTRLALPLFVGCAAAVFRGGISSARIVPLCLVVAVEALLNPALRLGAPGPVALIAGTLLLFTIPWCREHAPALGCVGLVQALYLPLPWNGYQPGLVVAWFVLAGLALPQLHGIGSRLPAVLEMAGRRPLAVYVGHLVVLLAVFR